MAMNENFNYSELCRLCSLKSNHQLQIFDKEGEQRQILFKIRTLIGSVTTKEDVLPKNICQKCLYKLDMFFEFRASCMATETVLKNYADTLKQLAQSVSNQLSIVERGTGAPATFLNLLVLVVLAATIREKTCFVKIDNKHTIPFASIVACK
ncbi:hypothetical protein KQX54_008598 [Cotesia glomerata]|uniref:ZAD domain-containing protein n=1 Tax=Cotesia glomerata TaxID=32391 RepID=A0AAV7J573_COTGL|nr:hypothetical protein KQX54_008598 [Cotesia glomerata]